MVEVYDTLWGWSKIECVIQVFHDAARLHVPDGQKSSICLARDKDVATHQRNPFSCLLHKGVR